MVKTPLYKVVEWNEHFENFKSRTIKKCAWVPIPNKHGGMGLSNVLGEPDGAMIYGLWMLLVQLCSRQAEREGWITADGKKEGRRLTGEGLAHTFRRPVLEIYRMLQVLSRAEVGWLELIDGVPEWEQEEVIAQFNQAEKDTARILQGYREDTTSISDIPEAPRTDTPQIEGVKRGYRKDTTRIPQGYLVYNEGRKEGIEEEPLPSPKRGLEEGIESDDPLQYAEAKIWLNALFHRKRHWSCEEDQLLSQIVPISRDDKALIDWAYGLSPSHRFQEQTKLKQELTTLLREFNGELDKIKTVRRRMGMNGAPKRQAELVTQSGT